MGRPRVFLLAAGEYQALGPEHSITHGIVLRRFGGAWARRMRPGLEKLKQLKMNDAEAGGMGDGKRTAGSVARWTSPGRTVRSDNTS